MFQNIIHPTFFLTGQAAGVDMSPYDSSKAVMPVNRKYSDDEPTKDRREHKHQEGLLYEESEADIITLLSGIHRQSEITDIIKLLFSPDHQLILLLRNKLRHKMNITEKTLVSDMMMLNPKINDLHIRLYLMQRKITREKSGIFLLR